MKKVSIHILAAILACTMANFSFAAEWRLTVKTKSGDLVYIDQNSILDSGTEKTITVKSNIVEGERSPASYELKYLINCSSKEVALIASTKYNAIDLMGDGQVLKTSNPPKKLIATEGSVFDYYLKAACVDKSTAKPINESTQTGRSLAANWRLVFKTNNAEIYIDQSSITNLGAEKTILVKSNEVQGERSPSSLELKYQVNCAANEVAVIGAKQYKSLDLQGDAVALNTSSPPKFIEAKPGSAASAYVKAACVDQNTAKLINENRQSPQQQTQTTSSVNQVQQQIKLKELLKNTWGWDDITIQNGIILETQNIKKQNPKFSEDQVRDAVYALWVKRAKEMTNPEIIRVNVPNAVQLANVDPRDRDFVYPVENISYCNQHCLSVADYKKTCSVVKNLTYQAAWNGGGSGMAQRLLEREGAISEVSFKMEKDIFGKDQCVMKYVLTGVFDGKKTGCRLYSLVTAFAVGQPGGIVVNNAYPLQTHAGSTCALY